MGAIRNCCFQEESFSIDIELERQVAAEAEALEKFELSQKASFIANQVCFSSVVFALALPSVFLGSGSLFAVIPFSSIIFASSFFLRKSDRRTARRCAALGRRQTALEVRQSAFTNCAVFLLPHLC